MKSASFYRQGGASLIEVLVTMVIILLGLLGLVGLMLQAQKAQVESYQRVQAVVMLGDMANRIRSNAKAVPCYATGANPLGTGYTGTPACAVGDTASFPKNIPTSAQSTRAQADMAAWSALLIGSSASGNEAGTMLGARGCVTVTDVTPACAPPTATSTGVTPAFTGVSKNYNVVISIAWQGSTPTAAVTSDTCGVDAFGDERLRRVVTVPVRINTAVATDSCEAI